MPAGSEFDYIILGAGSAGCAAALAEAGAGRILVPEARPTDRSPLVRMPMGPVWLLGSRRDWAFRSAPLGHRAGQFNTEVA